MRRASSVVRPVRLAPRRRSVRLRGFVGHRANWIGLHASHIRHRERTHRSRLGLSSCSSRMPASRRPLHNASTSAPGFALEQLCRAIKHRSPGLNVVVTLRTVRSLQVWSTVCVVGNSRGSAASASRATLGWALAPAGSTPITPTRTAVPKGRIGLVIRPRSWPMTAVRAAVNSVDGSGSVSYSSPSRRQTAGRCAMNGGPRVAQRGTSRVRP